MRKIHGFLTVMLLIMCFGSYSGSQEGLDIIHSMRNKLKKRIEMIRQIFEKYPGDGDLHVAAGDMCSLVGQIPNRPDFGTLIEYKTAVEVDPGNRLAGVLLMDMISCRYAGGVEMYQRDMKRADDIEAGKVEPPPAAKQAGHYKYLKTEEGSRVWAKNTRRSATKRKPTAEERNEVLKQLNESKGIDPDNALYNYFTAHIYFAEGDREKAITEVKKGLDRKYVLRYTRERVRAMKRLLNELDSFS